MGKLTISMAIFNCYVSSPEGIQKNSQPLGATEDLRNSTQFEAWHLDEACRTTGLDEVKTNLLVTSYLVMNNVMVIHVDMYIYI